MQALGQYSDAIKSLNASAELHPIADATGGMATLALNPLSAAEKAAGGGFSYAVGAPAAVKSLSNLAKLGVQAAKGASEIGTSGALSGTRAVGGQLAKAAGAGLLFDGVGRPAFESAVWVAANTLGIHADAPQPPTVTSLLQSAALSVLLAGHGLEFKEIPAGQVTSAMVRGKVRENLGIPLDSNEPQHIAQVTSYMEAKGVPIDSSNAQALTAPLTEGEQHLYTTLNAKIQAMKPAGKFDGRTGDFVPASQAMIPGGSEKSAATLSGGVTAVDKPGADSDAAPNFLPGASPASPNARQFALAQGGQSGERNGATSPGVTLTHNGGVDFSNSPDLYPISDGQANIVTIIYTGSRRKDYKAANRAGNIRNTQRPPTGYTWHHLDDYNPLTNTGTMQLIKTSTHEASYPHVGGG